MDDLILFVNAIRKIKEKYGDTYFKMSGLLSVLKDLSPDIDKKIINVLRISDELLIYQQIFNLQNEEESMRSIHLSRIRHDFVEERGYNPEIASIVFDSYLFGLDLIVDLGNTSNTNKKKSAGSAVTISVNSEGLNLINNKEISNAEVDISISMVNVLLKSYKGDRKKWAVQFKDNELFPIAAKIISGKLKNNELKDEIKKFLLTKLKSTKSDIVYPSSLILNEFIQIGKYKWSKKFSNTEKFNNGELIPFAKNISEWLNLCRAKKPAMCYFEFKYSSHTLYNYYAISSPKGIAPEGLAVADSLEGIDYEESFRILNLDKGILKVGADAQTGHYRKEFSRKEIMIPTLDRFKDSDDYDEDFIGTMYLSIEDDSICYTIQNGYWGVPLLLVQNEK
jgi:hypothetical protein